MNKVLIVDHPIILDKISRLRDRRTPVKEFRNLAGEISMLMVYEALKDVKLKNTSVNTPSHIGIYRNEETLSPVRYYFKMPRGSKNSLVVLLDPMLATGGSAVEAVNMLKSKGARNIVFLCLISAKAGLDYFLSKHPDVKVITAAVDSKLNNRGYIVPGLGDAGDRMFGT